MIASNPGEFTPLFDWSPRGGRKISLLAFISASAVLHALCFYVFQIVYPPTIALLPPPARVNLITPASEEGRALLRWIEAEDPALSSITQRPPNQSFPLPAPSHVPSYISRKPTLKEPPPYQPDLRVPSSRPPAPVQLSRSSTPAPVSRVATTLGFSEFSAAFGEPVIPSLTFATTSREPPQAAEFRVAFKSGGEVRYCFLQTSSGDSALDEQALRTLLLCRFPPLPNAEKSGEAGHVWTVATFEWGNDLAVPSPSPGKQPTP